ncbi:MAG: GNAT family N-acetyltransferase [Thermoplasmata archaeon]
MTTMRTMTTTSDIIVRRGSILDIEAVQSIECRAFGVHAYSRGEIENMLTFENSVTFILEVDGRVAGYSSLFFSRKGKIAHVESIAVDPVFQGSGLGRKLMDAMENEARDRGCEKIVLETFEKNERALRMYLKRGYLVKGIVEGYYTIPYEGSRNAVRLEKDIKVK